MSVKGNIYQWYEGLGKWRGPVIFTIIGTTIVGGYFIIKGYNDRKKQQESDQKLVDTVHDLDDLGNSGIHPSFQQSQYTQWADSIAQSFAGCDATGAVFGDVFTKATDIDNANNASNYSSSGAYVLGIIKQLENDADFLALQAAFGVKTISKHWWCGGDQTNVALSAAINDQLDRDEITALNTVLHSKTIKYSF